MKNGETVVWIHFIQNVCLVKFILFSGPCYPNPCKHGGTCFDNKRSMICKCPESYRGQYCEIFFGKCKKFVFLSSHKCIFVVNSSSKTPFLAAEKGRVLCWNFLCCEFAVFYGRDLVFQWRTNLSFWVHSD